MSGGGGSNDGSNDMQVSGVEAAYSTEPGISTAAESRVSPQGPAGGQSSGGNYTADTSTVGIAAPSYSTQELEKGYTDTGEKIDYYDGKPLTKSQAVSAGVINIDPETGKEEPGRYSYNENTGQYERRDLTFGQHYKNAPEIIKWSPTLKFLYASGKNIAEWGKNFDWTYNPQSGTFTDSRGDNVGERALMNAAAPQAPGLISNQATTPSVASQWYQNLGTTTASPFSFSTAYSDAKAKQQTILGNPSAVRQLAINESPFYNWLKDNSLNKGIL